MVRYSARAARALGFLKRHYNDVEVYVEDTSSSNMWMRFLERFIPEGVRLKSVNFLGGRENVVAACRLDQADDSRRKIYIIDGDFDFIRGKRKSQLKHLHRLPCYCIENMLVKTPVIIDAAFNCCTNTSRSLLNSKVHNVLKNQESLVRNLFTVYATCEHLNTGLKTVSTGLYPLMTKAGKRYELDGKKIWQKISELVRKAVKIVGLRKFSRTRKSLSLAGKKLPLEKLVSGKDFLLPLIWQKLQEIPDFSAHVDHFKVHLARSVQSAQDPLLRRKFQEFGA